MVGITTRLNLPKQLKKRLEIKLAKFMNNKRVLIHANNKQQQEKILGMNSLNGEKMKAHVPAAMAKLRGVISGVPLDMSMEDVN